MSSAPEYHHLLQKLTRMKKTSIWGLLALIALTGCMRDVVLDAAERAYLPISMAESEYSVLRLRK